MATVTQEKTEAPVTEALNGSLKDQNQNEKNVSKNSDQITTSISGNSPVSEQIHSDSPCTDNEIESVEPKEEQPVAKPPAMTTSELSCGSTISLEQKEAASNPQSPAPSRPVNMSKNGTKSSGLMDDYNLIMSNVKPIAPSESMYRDYSRLPCAQDSSGLLGSSVSSGKEPPFPVKLHKILSNPEYADIISWLPHGRSWRVLKPKTYEEKIIPKYFRHAKYASFMRQVNGWGFKRMTQGPDHNSYYHELFLRGLSHLCIKMRRPTKAKTGSTDSDINPDFYRLSMVAPLPNPDTSVVKDSSLEGLHDLGVVQRNALANMANVPSALGLQTAGMPVGGLTSNFPNLGVNGFNISNLPANALYHQQIQGHFQPGLTNAGTSGSNALGIPDMNSEMNQQIDALRHRREDIVRQLGIINKGHGSDSTHITNGPVTFSQSPGLLHNPHSMPNLASSLKASDLFSANLANNPGQLQQMMSRLQTSGFNMQTGDFSHHQSLGSIGMYAGGGAMNNMPGSVGGLSNNINQQLLLQHNLSTNAASGALGVPVMNTALLTPSLGNLGFTTQNQMYPHFKGSSQSMQNPSMSIPAHANVQQRSNIVQTKDDSEGSVMAENKNK